MKTTLRILGTSDLHGYLFSHSYANNTKANLGISNVLPIIQKSREVFDNVLLLDNGDTIQGSPLTYFHNKYKNDKKHFMCDLMNEIQFDAVNIGNHEFNYGIDYLQSYTDNLNCPVVCCNINKNGQKLYKDYIVKQYDNGLRLAVTGAVTHYIPHWEQSKNIESMDFEDAFESLKRKVKEIREKETIDFLVVMYHGGFEKDIDTGQDDETNTGENQGYRMLTEIEGIDLLLTGHQHRTIAYSDKRGTSILQPTCNGIEIAALDVEFVQKDNGLVINKKQAQIIRPTIIYEETSMFNGIAPLESDLQEWLDIPIGNLKTGNLLIDDLHQARLNKHDIVQFINDVQLEISGADISLNALANSVTGFNNNITYRDIISTYIYPNTLSVLKIDGKTLKKALHQNVQYLALKDDSIVVRDKYIYPKPQHYNYDMYDGISYDIIVGEEESSIENLSFKGHLIQDEDTFSIVMNNYRASGGGEFAMFPAVEVLAEIQTDMVEIIADYIMKYKVIDVVNAKNITVKKQHN